MTDVVFGTGHVKLYISKNRAPTADVYESFTMRNNHFMRTSGNKNVK